MFWIFLAHHEIFQTCKSNPLNQKMSLLVGMKFWYPWRPTSYMSRVFQKWNFHQWITWSNVSISAHTYTHVCVRVCIWMCLCVFWLRLFACVCARWVCLCAFESICVHLSAFVCVECVCVHFSVFVRTHTLTHAHSRTHSHIPYILSILKCKLTVCRDTWWNCQVHLVSSSDYPKITMSYCNHEWVGYNRTEINTYLHKHILP